MSLAGNILKRFGYVKKTPGRRNYQAGAVNRLTADWIKAPLSSDSEIRYTLKTMRARSRDLAINNDYARKFLKMCVVNVVGPDGITLQVKAKDPGGNLDRLANMMIENAFAIWSEKGNASVDGQLSWVDIQRLAVESVARDGEILIRKIKGFNNDFGFSLQLIEADHLDENLNKDLENGNKIRMGIEFDSWRKPVAYHILTSHPGDFFFSSALQLRYERIPAEDIIHLFIRERISQSRGVPWMHTAMTRLNMLGSYEEAALVAARAGACKMGFLSTPTGEEYTGDDKENGNVISETEPGMIEQLPAGWTFNPFDPKYPDANYQPFMKIMLRGIASGLMVAYNSLASDLEGVNYSSIRAGVIEERDCWKIIQGWLIEHLCDEVFPEWLDMALLTQMIKLPASKFDKFNSARWKGRGWAWVDPLKDAEANLIAVSHGFDTRTNILAESGYDFEEIVEQLAEEQAIAEKLGLDLNVGPDTSSGTLKDSTDNQTAQDSQKAEEDKKFKLRQEEHFKNIERALSGLMADIAKSKDLKPPDININVDTPPVNVNITQESSSGRKKIIEFKRDDKGRLLGGETIESIEQEEEVKVNG